MSSVIPRTSLYWDSLFYGTTAVENAITERAIAVRVHPGCCTGARTLLPREISQKYHANEDLLTVRPFSIFGKVRFVAVAFLYLQTTSWERLLKIYNTHIIIHLFENKLFRRCSYDLRPHSHVPEYFWKRRFLALFLQKIRTLHEAYLNSLRPSTRKRDNDENTILFLNNHAQCF